MTKTLTALFAAAALTFPAIALADPQPNMKEALEHLQKAKESLKKATADKGGHRVKAIELVDKAIEQTEKGMKFDDKH